MVFCCNQAEGAAGTSPLPKPFAFAADQVPKINMCTTTSKNFFMNGSLSTF